MHSASSAIERRAREVAKAIDDVLTPGAPGPQEVLAQVALLVGFDLGTLYSLEIVDGRARIESGSCTSVDDFIAKFDEFLSRAPLQFGSYDPLRPEPEQRNRVLGLSELGAAADSLIVRELYPKLGIAGLRQIRVLVCDGPTLLGWIGGWRASEFAEEERRALASLVAPLRRRLRAMAWLGKQGLHLEAMRAAMDAIGAPAFLVRSGGVPAHANAAGNQLLDADASITRARLSGALRGSEPGAHVTPICAPGVPPHHLVVLPVAETGLRARVEAAAAKWGLTPRQADVLQLLVQGHANKTVAATLGCSVRTIEVHVTAILDRVQCDSRSELSARFWREPP